MILKRCSTSSLVREEVGSSITIILDWWETAFAISIFCSLETDKSPANCSGSISTSISLNKASVSSFIFLWSTNVKGPIFLVGNRPNHRFSITLRCNTGYNSWWIMEIPIPRAFRESVISTTSPSMTTSP